MSASDDNSGRLFIGSAIDDAGLDLYEFRILARVSRRGQCFESIPNMANGCRMSLSRGRKALRSLAAKGWIVVSERSGDTKLVVLANPIPPLPDVTGVETEPLPNVTGDPCQKREGTPVKSDRLRKPPKETPEGERPTKGKKPKTTELERQAAAIYEAYPRRVNRRPALKAIAKALGSKPFAELLELTKAFAAVWVEAPESERKWIPYPATWFNSEGYDNEPKEWERSASANMDASGSKYRIA